MRFKVSTGALGMSFVACLSLFAAPASAANEIETAELLTKLMQVGRSVVNEHQDLINDAGKGNKGFTPEYLAERVIRQYKEKTNIDLNKPSATQQSGLLLTLLESGKEVVAEVQPIINKQGIAFKGFIPALWGRRTAEKFTKKTGIRLKLTALDYRFPGNKPDDFEAEALRVLSDPAYPKGKGYSKLTMMEGRQVFRLMTPEYASARCLICHGEPKGERDITGMKKEGLKEGDLAGAISLAIPVR